MTARAIVKPAPTRKATGGAFKGSRFFVTAPGCPDGPHPWRHCACGVFATLEEAETHAAELDRRHAATACVDCGLPVDPALGANLHPTCGPEAAVLLDLARQSDLRWASR